MVIMMQKNITGKIHTAEKQLCNQKVSRHLSYFSVNKTNAVLRIK